LEPDLHDQQQQFLYGDFINAVLAFVIVAAVIYFFVSCPTPQWSPGHVRSRG